MHLLIVTMISGTKHKVRDEDDAILFASKIAGAIQHEKYYSVFELLDRRDLCLNLTHIESVESMGMIAETKDDESEIQQHE